MQVLEIGLILNGAIFTLTTVDHPLPRMVEHPLPRLVASLYAFKLARKPIAQS
jgi:hypothetical protein